MSKRVWKAVNRIQAFRFGLRSKAEIELLETREAELNTASAVQRIGVVVVISAASLCGDISPILRRVRHAVSAGLALAFGKRLESHDGSSVSCSQCAVKITEVTISC